MDYKLELVGVPVSDVDRAIRFYVDVIGFNLDHDHQVSEDTRFVQLTPTGSGCSLLLGTGDAGQKAQPGRGSSLQLVVSDIEAAYADLKSRNAPISEIDDQPWGRFIYFADPDGNEWAVQQLPNYG